MPSATNNNLKAGLQRNGSAPNTLGQLGAAPVSNRPQQSLLQRELPLITATSEQRDLAIEHEQSERILASIARLPEKLRRNLDINSLDARNNCLVMEIQSTRLDGFKIIFNPNVISKLSERALNFVVAHEHAHYYNKDFGEPGPASKIAMTVAGSLLVSLLILGGAPTIGAPAVLAGAAIAATAIGAGLLIRSIIKNKFSAYIKLETAADRTAVDMINDIDSGLMFFKEIKGIFPGKFPDFVTDKKQNIRRSAMCLRIDALVEHKNPLSKAE